MPRVPYLDAPTVSAQTVPTPYSNVQATPNDFGAQAGAANIESGRQSVAGANQTIATALRLQQDQNETTRANMWLAGSEALSQAEYDFKSQKGQMAVQNMQPTIDRMKTLFQQQLDAAPNDQVRRGLAESLGRELAYSIKQVGGWAAYQGDDALRTSLQAQLGAQAARMGQRWNMPGETDRLLNGTLPNGQADPDSIVSLSAKLAQATGHDPSTPEGKAAADALVAHYTSEGISAAAKSALANGQWDGVKALVADMRQRTVPGTDVPLLDTTHGTALEQTYHMATQAALIDQQRQMLLQERMERRASEQSLNGYIEKMYSDDPKEAGQVTATSIANDDTLKPEVKLHLIAKLEAGEALPKVSQQTTIQLLGDMRRPAGDPQQITDASPIYNAFLDHKLTKSDFDFLQREYSNARTPEGERLGQQTNEFLRAVKPMIDKSNPLMGQMDPSGSMQLYSFQVDLANAMAQARKDGKNPYDLLNPSSPDYWGRPDKLAPYLKPLADSMRDVTTRLGRPATPATPAGQPPQQAPQGRPPLSQFFGR